MGIMYALMDGMGLISFLLGLFYLIGMPVLVFKLNKRVALLERRNVEVNSTAKSMPRIEEEETEDAPPEAKDRPMKTEAIQPAASVQTKSAGSFEEKVGAQWFQWIGIAALVAALLFFLKWSFDNGFVGPTGRTVMGYLFAGGAMIAGDRLRSKYGIWSLAFTGGGALGSYIVTWIALHTYHLFPAPMAFTIYVLTTAVTCLLAGYYGAIELAGFGLIGGFVTPLLTGQDGSLVMLLLYILILDLGIFALGRARQWRSLNVLGLAGTAIYQLAPLFESTFEQTHALGFAAIFFGIYIAIPAYYNLLKRQKSDATDILVLVGNALFHFGLILLWLEKNPGLRETYDALVSFGFAAVFLIFASEVYKRNKTDTPLVLGSLSLAILFASLAIPLQFGGAWVPLAWSIEGAFLFWIALTLRDSRLQRFAWIAMTAAYFWYLFVPTGTAQYYGHLTVHTTSGFFLFIVWTALFAVIAAAGLSRDDRGEHRIVPFVLTGLAFLTFALGMNIFMESESTLSGAQRFLEAAALIGGSYTVLFQAKRHRDRLTPDERSAFSALGIAVQIVTLVYMTDEFVRAVDDGRLFAGLERPWQTLQVGISVLWAAYGAAALATGFFHNWKPLRVFGLVVLMIAMAKLTLIDFFSLGTGYRVIGFTILGGLLVAASFLYQRKKDVVKSFLS